MSFITKLQILYYYYCSMQSKLQLIKQNKNIKKNKIQQKSAKNILKKIKITWNNKLSACGLLLSICVCAFFSCRGYLSITMNMNLWINANITTYACLLLYLFLFSIFFLVFSVKCFYEWVFSVYEIIWISTIFICFQFILFFFVFFSRFWFVRFSFLFHI